jgi:NADH:ubiquinone oxidoreductase subunit 6 (subunit J)
MKNPLKSLYLILAAGVAGAALFFLAQAQFTAALPAATLLGIAAALTVTGMAAADYSRRLQPLTPRARVLRPALPTGTAPESTAGDDRLAA